MAVTLQIHVRAALGSTDAEGTAAVIGIQSGVAGKLALDQSSAIGSSTCQGAATSIWLVSSDLAHCNNATSASLEAASCRRRTMPLVYTRPSSKGRAGLGADSGGSLVTLAAAGADRARKPYPECAPAARTRGDYQRAVGVKHEFGGSRQAARSWVQNPILFVMLTAITLSLVCAVEVLTTADASALR